MNTITSQLTVDEARENFTTLHKLSKIRSKKISTKDFLAILRENGGLYAKTARAIQKQYGIEYSRQSVKERALNYPEALKDIEEQNIDVAEEGLYSLMKAKDQRVKLRALEIFLKAKARGRGFSDRTEIEFQGPVQINFIQSQGCEPVIPKLNGTIKLEEDA